MFLSTDIHINGEIPSRVTIRIRKISDFEIITDSELLHGNLPQLNSIAKGIIVLSSK